MSDPIPVVEATSESFDRIIQEHSARVPVLVDFWAEWCAPCKMLMPVLDKLIRDYQGNVLLIKVNTDEQQELAAREGIRSLPTVRVYKNSSVVEELYGAQPEAVLREAIERHITRESDILRNQAEEALASGDLEGALGLLDQAAASDPHNHAVRLQRARVLLRLGRLEEARSVTDSLPPEVRDQTQALALGAELEFAEHLQRAPDIATLKSRLEQTPADSEARYQLGARLALEGDYEAALEEFLALMQRDREFGGDAARRALLGVFALLGDEGELVNRYRRRMFQALH